MIEINSGGVPVKAWVDGVQFEDSAKTQAEKLSRMPFIFKHVAIMPDAHWGNGACVGSVIPTKSAIIPAAVGVDIGCVDMDSEYLSPVGWRKISEYAGGMVMQYDAKSGFGSFVRPIAYVKRPSDGFYRFKTKYGVDQMLSSDHRCLVYKTTGRDRRLVETAMTAGRIASEHRELAIGLDVSFKATFIPDNATSLKLTDDQIRLQVAVHADGYLASKSTCVINLKKGRKKSRLRNLLAIAGVAYSEKAAADDATAFRFIPPAMTKSYSGWWRASHRQLQIISDECLHWDGNVKDRVFYTCDEESADFIQYAFTASGFRGVKRVDFRPGRKPDYRVFANPNTLVGLKGSPKSEIGFVVSPDGLEYCFTMPSGFWVMRRGGNIVVTGNCGMNAVKTNLRAEDLPDSMVQVRQAIEFEIPVGGPGEKGSWNEHGRHGAPRVVLNAWAEMADRYLEIRRKHPKVEATSFAQLGTLGGGNHFIEVCLDETGAVWVMLHSGSRGLGNKIGSYFIEKAKEEMREHHENLPDADLAFLREGTQSFDDYYEALMFAQDFAAANRKIMLALTVEAITKALGRAVMIDKGSTAVSCHHNYSSKETHFGEEVFVTRKGAVSARLGQLGIIPGSMGAKSFIVRGLGNPDSFSSCSHGAGRSMSRGEARRTITLEEHVKATEGVECLKDASVLDESPGAYKDIEAVMAAQADLVSIEATLKQILCIKGQGDSRRKRR